MCDVSLFLWEAMKISVIWTGMVGSVFAYRLMLSSLATEIALIDINQARAQGEALDIWHAAVCEYPSTIYATDIAWSHDSDIIVITAGYPRKNEETRLELLNKNKDIFKDMIPQICTYSPNAIYIIVSNPVDIMTYATIKYGNIDPKRIIGSWTTLDTVRFKYTLGEYFGVSPMDINAFVVGEHGNSQVALYSSCMINDIKIDDFAKQKGMVFDEKVKIQLAEKTKKVSTEIIEKKTATSFGIASVVLGMVKSIVQDEKQIFAISSLIDFKDWISTCISLPTILGKYWIEEVIHVSMDKKEEEQFEESKKNLYEYTKNM